MHSRKHQQLQEYPFLSMLIWTLIGVLATYFIAFLLNWDSVATFVKKSFLLLTLTLVATGYPLAKLQSFRKLNGGIAAFSSSQNKVLLAVCGGSFVCLFVLTWLQMNALTL